MFEGSHQRDNKLDDFRLKNVVMGFLEVVHRDELEVSFSQCTFSSNHPLHDLLSCLPLVSIFEQLIRLLTRLDQLTCNRKL